MPTVPTLDSPSVSLAALPNAREESVASPALLGAKGEQLENLGNAALAAGSNLGAAAYRMQVQADQVRVDDALNQARQKVLDLTYDPAQGYLSRKGSAALKPDDSGLSMPDSYSAKLKQSIDDISGQLGNVNQRTLFSRSVNDIATTFHGSAMSHMFQEGDNYSRTTQDGTIKIGRDTAVLNWTDSSDNGPRQQAIDSVKGAVAKLGQLTGEGASETVAKMKVAESGIHLGVIDQALQNNDPSYAMAYFAKNKANMTADDLLKGQNTLRQQGDASIALGASAAATREHASAFAPTDVDRLGGLLGQDVAKGEDPKIITPTLNKFINQYGNAAQAVAAFNSSPEAVDAAIKKANDAKTPEAWITFMPKETQAYVQTKMSAFAAGMGAPPVPTELDFVNTALKQLPPTAAPSTINLTREQAERQYKLVTQARKDQGDQVELKAMQAVIANGGDFAGLDPQIKSDLSRYDPKSYDNVMKFAKTVGRGDQATNLGAYNAAVAYPEELAKMNDKQFLSFLNSNFSSEDGKQIAKLRADLLNGKTTDSADAINSTALNSVLEGRLASLGIEAKPKRDDKAGNERVGAIQKFLRDDIYDQQKQLGRKMTAKEIEDRVDVMFTKDVDLPGLLYGTNNKNMLSMKAGDIPSAAADSLRAAFAKRGVKNPSDTDLLNAYWKWKNAP